MGTTASQITQRDESAGQRLAVALELHEFGVTMMRQNLRRLHPHASDDRIQGLLNDWLARDDEWRGGVFRRRA